MAYILEADIAKQKKVASFGATDSALVAVLIPAVESFAETFTKRRFKKQAYTEYFDGGTNKLLVANPPINSITTVKELTNTNADVWSLWTGYYRHDPQVGEIRLDTKAQEGFREIEIVYNGGFVNGTTWDAGYEDLRQALIELVVRKLDNATSGGKELTEVEADGYREKYSVIEEGDVPADIKEVLGRYRLHQV